MVKLKNGEANDAEAIKNLLQNLQTKYQEHLKSNINDANSQAQADLTGHDSD